MTTYGTASKTPNEFLPVIERLLELPLTPSQFAQCTQIFWSLTTASEWPKIFQKLIQNGHAVALFELCQTRNGGKSLASSDWPVELVKQFQSSLDPWVRLVCYLKIPTQVESTWESKLLQDLATLAKPIPRNDIQGNILALNAASYRARTAAMRELIQKGVPALPALRSFLDAPELDYNARQLVASVVKTIEEQHASYFEQNILRILDASEKKLIQRVLLALQKNPPESHFNRIANELLRRRE